MASASPRRVPGDLGEVFNRRRVRSLAGPRSFERGEDYARSGTVTKLRVTATSAEATVRGSAPYNVHLGVEDGEPVFFCTCPVGADGSFCKHAVALALVATEPRSTRQQPDVEADVDVRTYLEGLGNERLVDLVLELAAADELALARLRLDAAKAVAGPPPLRAFLDAIDNAFETDDYVSYREAYDYAERIREVIGAVRGLLDDGDAEAVIELCEHALERAEDAVGSVDDSNGCLGEIAAELQELHLAACKKARPDPVALAHRLFDWECDAGDLDVFSGAARTYAKVLGKTGLATYRQLAEAAFERLPALEPGDKRSYDGNRFRITHMMEALAETSGDVDAVVAVLAKDQSSPYDFVRIAEHLRAAGRFADALSWAEQGLEHFGPSADHRLLEVAADEYHRAGQGEQAVELAWRAFEERPSPSTYERLCAQGTLAGTWDTWRPRAVKRLRDEVAGRMTAVRAKGGSGTGPARWGLAPDASDLVQVFLFDGDVDQAWTEAKAGGCSWRLWLELARRREAAHPLDAIPIFEDEVERLIAAKNNDAYRQAVETMAHVQKLMRATAQPDAFEPYAAGVRARHKPKRNLMKLLDARSW
ncbi:MAG TPA: SWIM zinc finger family protein [Acidimicrobiales bacterium]|nr:SWIM zinc finger family protein [Acidimicrobiales bacterium]